MRLASAWFLIFISTSHLLGGHLWFGANYLMEVQRQMNETEQTIAAELRQEQGLESSVRILQPDELMQRGAYYNNFVFSTEIDSSVVYYTIDYAPKTITVDAVAHEQPPLPIQHSGKMELLKSLFKVFTVPGWEAPTPFAEGHSVPQFWVLGGDSIFLPSNISPPPDVA